MFGRPSLAQRTKDRALELKAAVAKEWKRDKKQAKPINKAVLRAEKKTAKSILRGWRATKPALKSAQPNAIAGGLFVGHGIRAGYRKLVQ